MSKLGEQPAPLRLPRCKNGNATAVQLAWGGPAEVREGSAEMGFKQKGLGGWVVVILGFFVGVHLLQQVGEVCFT